MINTYRILTYILIPLGVLFLFFTLASLLAALAGNVAALLPGFLCAGTLIYIYMSLNFLHKGVLGNQVMPPNHWDWIRVNGYVALFMGSLFIFQSIYFKDNPELTQQLQEQIDNMPEEIEREKLPDLGKIVSWVLNFMLACGALLVVHIFFTFSLLRKKAGLFGRE